MDKKLERLQRIWDGLGESDPLWAILSEPQKRWNRWNVASFFETGRQEIDAVLQSMTVRFPDVPRTCALDFGCGVGRVTRSLAHHFDRVLGVDVAPSMIRRAQELNFDVSNCEFVVNSRSDLTLLASGSVDFIYSHLVLQHNDRACAERYVREFMRLLSPQGLAVFQVPSQRDGSFRSIVARATPRFLLRPYRRLRYGLFPEINGIPVERVRAVVKGAGGRIGEESSSAGSGWINNWYYARL